MPSVNSRPSLPALIGTTVFVVEDDEAARHSAEALLGTMGHPVRAFASCEAFLAEIQNQPDGLLLLDYRFDGLTGLDLLDRLRERRMFIPTILFTGVFDASVKRRARGYDEVVAVLDKPLGGSSLNKALSDAAALRRSRSARTDCGAC